ISVKGQSRPGVIDLLPTGGLRAVERLMPAVAEADRWLPRTRGAFWYLDLDRKPRRLLDPTRTLAFARDVLPRIDALVRDIERQPASRRTSKIRIRPPGAPLDVHATERILRSRPELLE